MRQIMQRLSPRMSPEMSSIQTKLKGLEFDEFLRNQRHTVSSLELSLANGRDLELCITTVKTRAGAPIPRERDGHRMSLLNGTVAETTQFRVALATICADARPIDGAIACLDHLLVTYRSYVGRNKSLSELRIPAEWVDQIFHCVNTLSAWPTIQRLDLVFGVACPRLAPIPTQSGRDIVFPTVQVVAINYLRPFTAQEVEYTVAWLKGFLWCCIRPSHQAPFHICVSSAVYGAAQPLAALRAGPSNYSWHSEQNMGNADYVLRDIAFPTSPPLPLQMSMYPGPGVVGPGPSHVNPSPLRGPAAEPLPLYRPRDTPPYSATRGLGA